MSVNSIHRAARRAPTCRNGRSRRGAATTEFALLIGPLLLLTFGAIEICSAIFLRESVTIAAAEGARIAAQKMADEDDVVNAVMYALQQRNVSVGDLENEDIVEISRNPVNAAMLEPITVTVNVPTLDNTMVPHPFYSWLQIGTTSATVTVRKDFEHPNRDPDAVD